MKNWNRFAKPVFALALLAGGAWAQDPKGAQTPDDAVAPMTMPNLRIPPRSMVVPDKELVALVNDTAWCSSDDDRPVIVRPPTGYPPAEVNRGLANLIYREPTWSMSAVKRAIRLIGDSRDSSAIPLLTDIAAQASQLVALRSQEMARRIKRNEAQMFQAHLASQTADIQSLARSYLPPQ